MNVELFSSIIWMNAISLSLNSWINIIPFFLPCTWMKVVALSSHQLNECKPFVTLLNERSFFFFYNLNECHSFIIPPAWMKYPFPSPHKVHDHSSLSWAIHHQITCLPPLCVLSVCYWETREVLLLKKRNEARHRTINTHYLAKEEERCWCPDVQKNRQIIPKTSKRKNNVRTS
jgi:hypothetical protein